MNEYLIEKLKEGRINKGLKQSDVTQFTGIKNTTLSNYENGITEPDIDTFLQLCELYELDYAGILAEAYGLSVQGEDFKIRPSEIEVAKKYRLISTHSPDGAIVVDTVLDREYAVAKQLQENKKRIEELENHIATKIGRVKELSKVPRHAKEDTTYVNAAHAQDGASEEEMQHDEDIMDDKNF